jgi:hypothetical protein
MNRLKTWLTPIAFMAMLLSSIGAIFLAMHLGAQSAPETVNIQLVAIVRPNTVVGTVTFYDGGRVIGSSDAHGGVVRIVVPLTQGTHALQAKYVSSAPLYGNSQSQILSYDVDPANPLVLFGFP